MTSPGRIELCSIWNCSSAFTVRREAAPLRGQPRLQAICEYQPPPWIRRRPSFIWHLAYRLMAHHIPSGGSPSHGALPRLHWLSPAFNREEEGATWPLICECTAQIRIRIPVRVNKIWVVDPNRTAHTLSWDDDLLASISDPTVTRESGLYPPCI